jgi:uncharacterized protein with FMN-binding domain
MKFLSIGSASLIVLYFLYRFATGTTSGVAMSVSTGPWKDGTYHGQAFTHEYGVVQVSAVIASGKLTDVTFDQMPQDRSRSAEISQAAQPQLLQEALAAQSSQVDIVSGATLTTESFSQSLNSALTQAK